MRVSIIECLLSCCQFQPHGLQQVLSRVRTYNVLYPVQIHIQTTHRRLLMLILKYVIYITSVDIDKKKKPTETADVRVVLVVRRRMSK